jgi:hypothetical protein
MWWAKPYFHELPNSRTQRIFFVSFRCCEILDCRAELAVAYRAGALVSCHNDLFKPDNVLFMGNGFGWWIGKRRF